MTPEEAAEVIARGVLHDWVHDHAATWDGYPGLDDYTWAHVVGQLVKLAPDPDRRDYDAARMTLMAARNREPWQSAGPA